MGMVGYAGSSIWYTVLLHPRGDIFGVGVGGEGAEEVDHHNI